MKTFIKSKSAPNAAGPKYRTPDHFTPRYRSGDAGKGSLFSGGKSKFSTPQQKFNPAQFKTQHKG